MARESNPGTGGGQPEGRRGQDDDGRLAGCGDGGKGQRVLLVDLDPQGCLTFSLGQDPDKLPVSVHEVLLGDVEPNAALVTTTEGMTLLPANIDLAGPRRCC